MTTFAQEKEVEQGQLWYCWEATVYPDKTDQFVAFNKEELVLLKEMNYPVPFYAWTDDQFHYYYYIPMNSYEDIFKLQKALTIVHEKMGEEKTNLYLESLEYHEDYFIRYLPDISFTPEKTNLTDEDNQFAFLITMYTKPEKESKTAALLKELSEHAKSVGYPTALHRYKGDLGNKGSTFTTIIQAKSVIDFWITNEKGWELFGEKGKEIFQKINQLINKREYLQIWYLEDLSYIPVKEEIEE